MSDSHRPVPVTAVFGGGCFWCTEAVFKMLRGVLLVEPGYAGGTKPNPTYEDVCAGDTGHAEVIRVTYEPEVISYKNLLAAFFASHDPTTLNRQGADIGTQYRSIILAVDDSQLKEAAEYIDALMASDEGGKPIVTEVKPLEVFYPAEDFHRDYYEKNPGNRYCQLVIDPKVEKARKELAALLK